MKKKSLLRRLIALILSTVLLVIAVVPANAIQIGDMEIAGAIGITDEDLFISEEVATYIAQFFVADMVASETTSWGTETSVVETVTMYDETGSNITGYTIELTDGYVVVAAYIDMPSIILEWSDESAPLYKDAEDAADDKIIYLGVLDYFVENSNGQIETIFGEKVATYELSNDLVEMRCIDNVDNALLDVITETKEIYSKGEAATPLANTPGDIITDVFEYAQNVYGGSWSTYAWFNSWENYMNFATTSNFYGYMNHCGPTAITNIIKSYGNRANDSYIKSSTDQHVFEKVIEANNVADGAYYDPQYGTWVETTGKYIVGSFAQMGVFIRTFGPYYAIYDNIEYSIGYHRLLYVILQANEPYGNHAVVGYAYNRLKNDTSGAYLSFLKIADGWHDSPRFIPISVLQKDEYVEVYIP